MKKQLLQLTGIYTAAVLSGVFAFTYISNGINALAVQPDAQTTISTTRATGPQRSVVGPQVQPAYVYSSILLQPATKVQPTITVNPQANQVGGNGQDFELQPALGYGALNEVIQ